MLPPHSAGSGGCRGQPDTPIWRDPALEVLQERGLELEKAYLSRLRQQGYQIAEPGADRDGSALERTITAMRDGARVIYQATLKSGRWHGRADFLKRIEQPSRLGAWRYEVLDAKLARETRAGTILQLCLYSNMLADIQDVLPERMHVIMPGADFGLLSFRVHDFIAYHRLVHRRLEAAINVTTDHQTPIPTPCRNATSAAGGRCAIGAAMKMTIFVLSREYRSSRSTSFGAGASSP